MGRITKKVAAKGILIKFQHSVVIFASGRCIACFVTMVLGKQAEYCSLLCLFLFLFKLLTSNESQNLRGFTISDITCFEQAIFVLLLEGGTLHLGDHSCTTGNRSPDLHHDSSFINGAIRPRDNSEEEESSSNRLELAAFVLALRGTPVTKPMPSALFVRQSSIAESCETMGR